jgi:aryl-alcohol dehydrogenase-like predicted oxidoreductase
MDALASEARSGRIGVYGASNWTTSRLAKAAAWAVAHGIAPFAASSPNLSLAVPVVPPWPGCISAGDRRSLAWYRRTQLPLLAWSPLARGYFSEGPVADEAAMRRAFDSPRNRRCRRRAQALASQMGVRPDQVALAWVLDQAFPTAAVIGARAIAELEASVEAATIDLSMERVRYLAEA